MIKNLIKCIVFSIVIVFLLFNSAFASVNSVNDIRVKMRALSKISDTDYLSFINKNELIGDRLYNFNMITNQYKNEALSLRAKLESIIKEINNIRSFANINESDKSMQINKLYTEAENLLNSFRAGTMRYLLDLQGFMPSITYTRYSKKFKIYFNDLNLTDSDIPLK